MKCEARRCSHTTAGIFVLFLAVVLPLRAQEGIGDSTSVPFTALFYHLDRHFLGTFTDDYGLRHAAAIAGSYGIVRGGWDWQWLKFSASHQAIPNAGFVSVGIGGTAPIILPLGAYAYGLLKGNRDLQVTGLALGQSAILAVTISSALKAITGRRPPGERHFDQNASNYSTDFKFGFLNRGAFNGWPSSHTMNAFAMATTLSELYPENTTIQIVSLTYASLIGLGVSTNIHWFSDAFAGALMGYSIGKVVGTGFRQLLQRSDTGSPLGLSLTGNGVTLSYRF